MSSERRFRLGPRGNFLTVPHLAALALVVVAFGASAAAAAAKKNVNIVRQAGPPAGKSPRERQYYKTIQDAVNASSKGDWVLIEPGTYHEAVTVRSAQSGIWIRGMDRNKVIIDGEGKAGNGIEIYKANNVWVENLTVRNFETGPGCNNEKEGHHEGCGNEIWWNGGSGSGKIGATGWYGSYLTAYDTGPPAATGSSQATRKRARSKTSTRPASTIRVSTSAHAANVTPGLQRRDGKQLARLLGLKLQRSTGDRKLRVQPQPRRHRAQLRKPGDGPPPLDGACNSFKNTSPTPKFESTKIKRCELIPQQPCGIKQQPHRSD